MSSAEFTHRLPQKRDPFGQPIKMCEQCGATTTPMWRRGPSGTSTLCNACGVAWRLKKPKGEPDLVMVEAPAAASTVSLPREDDKNIVIRSSSGGAMVYSRRNEVTGKMEDIYHCKFCDQAWPASYFRNRQQFGAHCSNCSRRRNVGPPEGVLRLSGALPLPPKKKAPAPKPKRPAAESESDGSLDDEESEAERRPIKRSHSDSLRLLQENATQLLRQDDGERERLHAEVETLQRDLEEKRQRTVDELRALRVDFKRELSQLAGHAEAKMKNLEDVRARDEEAHYEGVYLEIEQLKASLQAVLDSDPAADPKWAATAAELERRVEALLKKISMLSTAVPQSPVSNSSVSPPHSPPLAPAPPATSAQLQDMKTALLEEVSARMDALFKGLEAKRGVILSRIATQREKVLGVANYVSMFSPHGPRTFGSPAGTPATSRSVAAEPVNTATPL